MNGIASAAMLICTVSAAATMLSLFIPQRRTRKILGFVIGLFLLVTIGEGIVSLSFEVPELPIRFEDAADVDNGAYEKAILRETADHLVLALDSLLKEDGILADDIRLSLKKSEDHSISVDRIVIYINGMYRDRIDEIAEIVYWNLDKEPEVYVTASEAR